MIASSSLSYLHKIHTLNKTIGMRWIVAPYRVKRVALVAYILAITLIPSLLYINTTTDTSSLEAFAYLDQTYQSYEHILTDL